MLPIDQYGSDKYSVSGLAGYCRGCIKFQKNYRLKTAYGRDTGHLSHVAWRCSVQNQTQLSYGLLAAPIQMKAIHIPSKIIYDVAFVGHKDEFFRVDISLNGVIRNSLTLAGSDQEVFMHQAMEWLRFEEIRLERDSLSVHNALTEIYFI